MEIWIGKNDGTDIDTIKNPTKNQKFMLSCLRPGTLYKTREEKDYRVERVEIYLKDDFMAIVVADDA